MSQTNTDKAHIQAKNAVAGSSFAALRNVNAFDEGIVKSEVAAKSIEHVAEVNNLVGLHHMVSGKVDQDITLISASRAAFNAIRSMVGESEIAQNVSRPKGYGR